MKGSREGCFDYQLVLLELDSVSASQYSLDKALGRFRALYSLSIMCCFPSICLYLVF